MKKRFMTGWFAVLTAAVLLLGLVGCSGNGQTTVMIADGWLIRSDAQNAGETEGWSKGFSEQEADGVDNGEVVWYCNTFEAALSGGNRQILTLCDIDDGAKVWLNGKELDYSGGWGDTRLDVTGTAKKNGKNTLVIRTEKGKAWSLSRTALSAASDAAIMDVAVTANGVTGKIDVQVQLLEGDAPVQMTVTATDTGAVMAKVTAQSQQSQAQLSATLSGVIPWKAINPYLYTLEITAGTERYSTDIGFADHGLNENGELSDGGESVMVKAVVMPESIMADNAKMRTFVNFIRTAGFNTLRIASGRPTRDLLAYCGATGIYVEGEVQDATAPALAQLPTDLAVFGEELVMPETVDATKWQAWYEQYGLDQTYAGAGEVYDAVGAAHVQTIEKQLRQLRAKSAVSGFVYAGSIAPYPDTMMDVLSDSVNDLRFCIQAADAAQVGDRLAFTVKVADFHALWDREFTATVKVSGPGGVIYEEKVTFRAERGNKVTTLLSDSVVIGAQAGTYTVSAVFDNYAHPTCGEKTVTVWDRGKMPTTVYAVEMPNEARAALLDMGVGVADAVLSTIAG